MMTLDTVQTVSATKVFTAEQQRKSTTIDITTAAETYIANNAFRFLDKNETIMGYVENGVSSVGVISAVHAKNKDNYQSAIGVIVPQSGATGAYGIAPVTPVGAPDNAIVTVSYADQASRGYLVETYQSGDSWYRVYSDGWIEQGSNTVGSTGIFTLNFLHNFTTTNYMFLTHTLTGSGDYTVRNTPSVLYTRTTSTIQLCGTPNFGNSFMWYACGY